MGFGPKVKAKEKDLNWLIDLPSVFSLNTFSLSLIKAGEEK
jgi:hypothetical protein